MARVLLVVPPSLPGTTSNPEGSSGLGALEPVAQGFRYPPHTVATLTATLRRAGQEVLVLDAPALEDTLNGCLAALQAAHPDLIGVFVSWATREADQRFLAALRALGLAVPVVAFGVSVRWMTEALAEADYGLQGEPELSFPALAAHLLAGQLPAERIVTPALLGLTGYDEQGLLRDLDDLPYPAWDLLPIERYPFLSVLSSRGCSETCRWCPYTVAQGRRFRSCSPERVVAELRELVTRYRPRRVVFRDPVFAHDSGRVEAICRQIIAERVLKPGKALLWECESRPEHLNRGLLRLMSLAGCVGIKVGLETTDAELLQRERRIHAGQQAAGYLAQVAALARDCARLGIACRLFVLAGLPGQTLAATRDTAGLVRALAPDALAVKVYKAYPGLVPPSAPLPSEEELRAQVEVLSEAQQALTQHKPSRLPRWRRALEQLPGRLGAALPWGRG